MREPAVHTVDPAYVGVALDLPIDRLFTYRVAPDLRPRARVGHRVTVPFRNGRRVGIVAATSQTTPVRAVKDVADAPDEAPLLDAQLMELAGFVARYYGSSFGEAATAMVPRGVRVRGGRRSRVRVRLAADAALPDDAPGPSAATLARTRVLRLLRRHPEGFFLTDLCRRAGVSASPIKTLVRRGLATETREEASDDELVEAAARPSDEDAIPPTLTDEQQSALDEIRTALETRSFAPFLLLGVTGSGKTEIYLQAIEDCRRQQRQAIVLVPEIALTPQTVRRFRARFDRVAVLHSAMTERDRAIAWNRIRAGEADVVIGPRSAVFAPCPRLGLIVVDEEHETSFKQQNTPRYHARDVALVRARLAGALVILGSATPALETYRHALEGRYGLLRLRDRVPGRRLPTVQIADCSRPDERASVRSHLSRTLEVRMREALRAKGQVILLQNRRGYATSVACMRCGYVVPCEHCDVSLTYHRRDAIALCHLCGHEAPVPRACPDCALPGMRFRGVGTQTVEEQLGVLFPDARVARMDSDTMATREAYEDVLDRFGRREIDVLVGTQMIAKGHDFPHVTLVGIVSADTALALPDFRAAERTFDLVAQVAGRAGRGDVEGRVVVQTRLPDHPAIRLAATQDYEAFAVRELQEREAYGYPPYRRLLRVVVRGRNDREVDARAEATRDRIVAAATEATQVLGPAVPPVARVQGMVRRHVLVKAPDHREVAAVLAALRSAPRPRRGIEEIWDVDPVGVL